MADYVIGDIHGCFETLTALLERIKFDSRRDRLFLVGDLVNRGPGSLPVLRWAQGLGDRVTAVLGNHDCHLLARWQGLRKKKPLDTLEDVLDAPDAEGLLQWLRNRPLLHEEKGLILVHAGFHPAWSLDEARERARQAEATLQGKGFVRTLGDLSSSVRPGRDEQRRRRVQKTLKILTLTRTCTKKGEMCKHSGSPEEAPPGCIPWFQMSRRWKSDSLLFFGHWAALGLYKSKRVIGLDTGCVWGGSLTAMRLPDLKVFQEPSRDKPAKKKGH